MSKLKRKPFHAVTNNIACRSKNYLVKVYSERAPLQYLLPGYLGEYMQNRLAKAGVTPVGESSLKDLRYANWKCGQRD